MAYRLKTLARRLAACMLMAFFATSLLTAQVPATYYRTCSGKSGADLKNALHTLIYTHNEVSSYEALPDYFRKTDVYPPGNSRYGQWWDMYSDIPLRSTSFSGLNREHSLPKSWWGGSTTTPAYVDLYHLYPSEKDANMAKSNFPLGEVSTPSFNNSITKVGFPVSGQGGGAQKVFEPADEYKGDFARTYFYMATCYQNLHWTEKYTYMLSNNTFPTLNAWSVNLLLKWHRQDPVSEKERTRQEEVYKVQSNRNPFIDYPELAEYLWGNKQGLPWTPGSGTEPEGDPELIAPVNGLELEFGELALGDQASSVVIFRGVNLTNPIALNIIIYERTSDANLRAQYQEWAKMFTVDTKLISAASVNRDGGVAVRVNYSPTALGQHLAKLSIEGDPKAASRSVVLRGTGCAVPTLSKIEALATTDVTGESYTARWATAPLSEAVDYYVITRTIINGSNTTTETIEAEAADDSMTAEYPITGCIPGTQETYTVQSSRLGHLSPMSNVITVNLQSGIADVVNDNPLGWIIYPGGVRIVCGEPHTGVRIYDTLGRQIRYIDRVENNTEIELPYGAFFIVTDQQHSPAKILVKP